MKKLLLLISCMLSVMVLWAQRTITGKVTDKTATPLPMLRLRLKRPALV
jgi:hypothetical protein